MARVKLLESLYPYGNNGDIVNIPDSDLKRLGSSIEVLEKTETLKVKNRKVSKKTIKTK